DSPVPRPLQVATDVALTHQAQQCARALALGKIDLASAQTELLAAAQLARRLGARIDPAAMQVPFHQLLHELVERLLSGGAAAASRGRAAPRAARGPPPGLWGGADPPLGRDRGSAPRAGPDGAPLAGVLVRRADADRPRPVAEAAGGSLPGRRGAVSGELPAT